MTTYATMCMRTFMYKMQKAYFCVVACCALRM